MLKSKSTFEVQDVVETSTHISATLKEKGTERKAFPFVHSKSTDDPKLGEALLAQEDIIGDLSSLIFQPKKK